MGAGKHAPHLDERVVVGARARSLLLGFLVLCAAVTVAGLVVLWPDGGEVDAVREGAQFAAPGVTFPKGEVTEVQEACPVPEEFGEAPPTEDCGRISATVLDGDAEGEQVSFQVPASVLDSGLRAGDTVELQRTPGADGVEPSYSYFATDRDRSLLWLAIAFAVIVVVIARLRGLMAMVGLVFSGFVVLTFVLPALLTGESGPWVSLVAASAIMYVVLYSTHGISLRTSAALAGTLVGVALTAGIALWSIGDARLTGVSDDSGGILGVFAGDLDFRSLLAAGFIIAGLGVLNDVTISQASSVWELRAASPTMSRRAVFQAGMRIGRDHIASTIYTIVFAYAGSALIVLMLLAVYDRPLLSLVSSEQLAEEIARTLTSGIGLVLATPITTAIAAAVASPRAVEPDAAVGRDELG